MTERISGLRRLAYSAGMAGFQITDRIVIGIALYYYLPPAGRGLVPQVPEKAFWGPLTVFGLAMLVGRILDSLADPIVGYASDRSRSRLGRRRAFLIYGLVPLVVSPALLFWPPGPAGSWINGLSLALVLCVYFIAFTVYVAPYLALLPELSRGTRDRTRLATLLALVSLPVVGLYGALWPYGIEWGRELGLDPQASLRVVVVVSLGLAFLLCGLPILAVDEQRFARGARSDLALGPALRQTLRDRPFRIYLGAQLLLILAASLTLPLPIYYATVVLGRSEGFAGTLQAILFGTTLLGFLGMHWGVPRVGPKRAMIGCCALFAVALASLGLLDPDVPGGPRDARNLGILIGAMALVGVPIAGFLVLPHVLIGQVIDRDGAATGTSRSAMYFGVQGLLSKWMYGLASALLAFLFARYGNSADRPGGLLMAAPIGALACAISGLLLMRYPESEVLAATAEDPLRSPR